VLNDVCENLIEGTTLMHITNLGTKLRLTLKVDTILRFFNQTGYVPSN